MKRQKDRRGFRVVTHPTYGDDPETARVVQESSAIGDYVDSMTTPGSSFLWVGENHHLNREEVKELTAYLEKWLKTGRL